MADPQRVRRVSGAVREVVAEGVAELKDPRVGFVTITDVRTSTDLKRCEVFFTVLPDDADTTAATLAALEAAVPVLRREVGARVRLRFTPELTFLPDPLPGQAERIERLLRDEVADVPRASLPPPGADPRRRGG